jgi:polyisoprenoid-binding protein YceI
MLKYTVVFAVAGILTIGAANRSSTTTTTTNAGAWQVDASHSDAQFVTDATTNYGKQKMNATLGFARVNGIVILDDGDPTQSRIDLHIYPAMAMSPPISEDGKALNQWLASLANNTLLCFHSKKIVRSSDGRLQTTGDLVLTRVDRNIIESNANEGYSGPVYGPPMIHRMAHEATFVFNLPAASANQQKDSNRQESGSTSLFRENFPQLIATVVKTYWPPVVQDENCQYPGASEDYHGAQCKGTVLKAPALPQAPHAGNLEDFPGPSGFNTIVGNQMTILVHMRLTPQTAQQAAAGE